MQNHNSGKWLTVAWLPSHQGHGHCAGWYVIRICPCHPGEKVTVKPYDTEEKAKVAREVILTLRRPDA